MTDISVTHSAKVMLDTNIISSMMREPAGAAMAQLKNILVEQPDLQVCTSVIVDSELQFGLQLKASARLAAAYERVMQVLPVLPLEPEVSVHYGRVRAQLSQLGKPIGPNDMLIAAHALSLDCILVTDNEAEFCRVPGLRVQNWLK